MHYSSKTMLLSMFPQLHRKAHRTFRNKLKDADVGILWSIVMEETGILPRGNHGPRMCNHYPATCQFWESNWDHSSDKHGVLPCPDTNHCENC